MGRVSDKRKKEKKRKKKKIESGSVITMCVHIREQKKIRENVHVNDVWFEECIHKDGRDGYTLFRERLKRM